MKNSHSDVIPSIVSESRSEKSKEPSKNKLIRSIHKVWRIGVSTTLTGILAMPVVLSTAIVPGGSTVYAQSVQLGVGNTNDGAAVAGADQTR